MKMTLPLPIKWLPYLMNENDEMPNDDIMKTVTTFLNELNNLIEEDTKTKYYLHSIKPIDIERSSFMMFKFIYKKV